HHRHGVRLRVHLFEHMRLVELSGDLRHCAATTTATTASLHPQSELRWARMRGLRDSGRLRRHLLLHPARARSMGLRQPASGRVLVRWPVLLRLRDVFARSARGRELRGELPEHALYMPVRLEGRRMASTVSHAGAARRGLVAPKKSLEQIISLMCSR